MNLSQLYYFRKLAELEHYGRAAKELFITQPSLSNSISNLEKELGVSLFERVGRGVRLTKYGSEFYDHIRAALQEVDKGVDAMRGYSEGLDGCISIGTVVSIQGAFLPLLLSDFKKTNGSSIDFDMYQDTTYGCLAGLQSGQYDVAFCGRIAEERGVHYIPVLTQKIMVGMNANHPLAEQDRVTFDQLKEYPLLTYRSPSYARTIFEGLLRRHSLNPRESFGDEISAASLATTDERSVVLILDTLGNYVNEDFITLPIEGYEEAFHVIYLAYREDSFHSFLVECFIDFVRERTSLDEDVFAYEDALYIEES